MPRRARGGTGSYVYHVVNRAVRRTTLLSTETDFHEFVQLLFETLQRRPMRLLAYCAMHTHFHLVVWPEHDGELASFMLWLTGTHARRWHQRHGTSGTGAVYQGRYKAIPVETDRHFLTVCRYVERNPLRAGLVPRAEDWLWSSLTGRCYPRLSDALNEWPVARPVNWVDYVNEQQGPAELAAVQEAVRRSLPYGAPNWRRRTADRLGLDSHLRPAGRPHATELAID